MDEHDPRWEPQWEDEIPGPHWVIVVVAVALTLALVSACSTIDLNNRVEGWPTLKITENKVSFSEVQDRCKRYVPAGQWPLACAEFFLSQKECVIWYAFDSSLGHERLHCLGYDHVGSDHMRKMFSK